MKPNPFNNNDWTSYNEQRQRQQRHLEWIISASVGASIALIFVIVHQIFFV